MKQLIDNTSARLALAKILWGWIPHPTQREWFLDSHQIKTAACGRRWGKTEAAAVDAATLAIFCPGSAQMIVSPTYDQSRLIFDTIERLLLGNRQTERLTKIVRTPYPRAKIRGSIITARTADEDGRNLRGHSADRVIVDEAAFVRDSVIDEVLSPMLADRNGKLVLISTPSGKNHFYRAFMKGFSPKEPSVSGEDPEITGQAALPMAQSGGSVSACGRHASFRFPSWLNPHISKDYIECQRSSISERQFRVEYEAQFLDSQRSVFRWEDIEACAESIFKPPSTVGYKAAGIDWARYSDYTAVVVLDLESFPYSVVALDRFHRLPWSEQIERVAELLEAHGVSSVLTDITSIGDPLLEQLKCRLIERGKIAPEVSGYTFTSLSKRALIDNLALRMVHRAVRFPKDERLIRELRHYEFEVTQSGNVRMNAVSGEHDDLVIALALAAWVGFCGNAGPAEFLSGGSSRLAENEW